MVARACAAADLALSAMSAVAGGRNDTGPGAGDAAPAAACAVDSQEVFLLWAVAAGVGTALLVFAGFEFLRACSAVDGGGRGGCAASAAALAGSPGGRGVALCALQAAAFVTLGGAKLAGLVVGTDAVATTAYCVATASGAGFAAAAGAAVAVDKRLWS